MYVHLSSVLYIWTKRFYKELTTKAYQTALISELIMKAIIEKIGWGGYIFLIQHQLSQNNRRTIS